MMTAKQILIDGLKAMGADGLYNDEGDPFCGCGLDDLAPCEASCEGGISLDGCRPAKREGKYNFYPMEEQYGGGTMSEEAKYGGQCSCGAQIIKKEGGDWHCSKCRSDILERAKAVVGKCHLVRETELLLPELIAEVERLRSENLDYSCIARDLDFDITKKARLIDAQHDGILRLRKRLAAKDARIKELEAELELCNRMAKEQIENSTFLLNGHIAKEERLEVAFLRSNAAMRYYQEGNRGPWPQLGEKFKEPYQEKAREALARIKEERKG